MFLEMSSVFRVRATRINWGRNENVVRLAAIYPRSASISIIWHLLKTGKIVVSVF